MKHVDVLLSIFIDFVCRTFERNCCSIVSNVVFASNSHRFDHRRSSRLRLETSSTLVSIGKTSFRFVLFIIFRPQKDAENRTGLNDTIRSLQLTLEGIQSSVRKLEQAADQLHLASLNRSSSASMLEEIKGEIQSLKGLCLNRSQFPSIPSIPARIPSWQLEAAEVMLRSSNIALDQRFSLRCRNRNRVLLFRSVQMMRIIREVLKRITKVSLSFLIMTRRVMMNIAYRPVLHRILPEKIN